MDLSRSSIRTWRAERLVEFDTYWHEDPFRLDNVGDLKDCARHCKAWICAAETLAYTHAFREDLETGAASVVMLDLSWCGGLSEARKIAAMAEARHVPVAPHDCTGPVVYMASCHFSMHARNALIQESVRAFYTGWYKELVTELPVVSNGEVTLTSPSPVSASNCCRTWRAARMRSGNSAAADRSPQHRLAPQTRG